MYAEVIRAKLLLATRPERVRADRAIPRDPSARPNTWCRNRSRNVCRDACQRVDLVHIMRRWAKDALGVGAGMAALGRAGKWARVRPAVLIVAVALGSACSQQNRSAPPVYIPPRVLVVAPVLNLSGSQDFDPLKVTDLVASEFLSFKGVAIVPVNLTLAELERQGKRAVDTPADAIELARALGADATIVTAVTEYNPYYPPVVGLIMQWYPARLEPGRGHASAHSTAGTSGAGAVALSDIDVIGPRWQLQRVFNAADEDVVKQIRSFASERDGDTSPYGWRKCLQSQELYLRFCSHTLIFTMLRLDGTEREVVEPHGTKL